MVAGVEIGVDENIAKGAGQALVSGDVKLLVAEKDHAMTQKRGADFGDDRRTQGGRQIDPGNLRAEGGGQRRDGQRAGPPPA